MGDGSPRPTLRARGLVLLLLLLLPSLGLAQEQFEMEFRNARIDDILRILAERFDANVALTGQIEQTVTVNLTGLGLEESLDGLLTGSDHTWERQGGVIRVMPNSTPVTRVFVLHYTTAAQLAQVIAVQVPSATVSAESHSNSLLVTGPIAAVREIEWLVEEIDRYRNQVSIRAEMVEVTLNEEDARGVDLGVLFSGRDADGELTTSFATNNETGLLSVHTLQGDVDISSVLSTIREDRDASLLSSPEITTLDNQPASIHVGERVPYQRATTETNTGATLAEVEFIDVGVKLEVTPTVSDDELLYLSIHSEVSEVLDQSVQNVPRIGTREADTRVLVRSGDTVVIGGLMKDNNTRVTKAVPVLGKIPILGWLFKRESVVKTKTELLVLIHPVVVQDPTQLRPTAKQQELRENFPSLQAEAASGE